MMTTPERYFDCTEAAEFLYACVARAIDKDLPQEIDFLRRNDEATRRIMNMVEMPDRMAENLVRFIRLNEGKLGHKRREGEFEKLTDEEVISIEAIVREAFDGIGPVLGLVDQSDRTADGTDFPD